MPAKKVGTQQWIPKWLKVSFLEALVSAASFNQQLSEVDPLFVLLCC